MKLNIKKTSIFLILLFIFFSFSSFLMLAHAGNDDDDDDSDMYFFFDGKGERSDHHSVSKSKTKTILRDHEHDDLFGEKEIFLGFKLGPQISGYTAYKVGTGEVSVQSSFRAAGGLATEFVYELLRFELDMFWSFRGKLNEGDDLHSIAFPGLVKIPLHITESLDFEGGLGPQIDFPFAGFEPRRGVLFSGLAEIGLLADLDGTLFSFESRYILGLQSVASNINGAIPREFQILGGLLWHF